MTTPIVPTLTDEVLAVYAERAGRLSAVTVLSDDLIALLAERAELKQQLAAASVDAERMRDIVRAVVDEIPHRSAVRGNAPGHGHDVPGIWDSDNGPLAGKECAWCKTWHSALDAARNIDSGD